MFDLFIDMILTLIAIALFGCFIKWVWHSPKNEESREINRLIRNSKAESSFNQQTGNHRSPNRLAQYNNYAPFSNMKRRGR